MRGAVAFEDVSFGYQPGQVALRNVRFAGARRRDRGVGRAHRRVRPRRTISSSSNLKATQRGWPNGDARCRAVSGSAYRSHARTTFVIAHRLSTVRNADLILLLDHGRLVEQGRYDELVRRDGLFAELDRQGRFKANPTVLDAPEAPSGASTALTLSALRRPPSSKP